MSGAVDVLVVGAGITGASAALELAKAGAKVEVIDAFGPAAMASGWTLAGVRQSGRHPAELPLAKAAVARWPELDETLGAPTHYRQKGNLRLARTEAEIGVIQQLVANQSAAGLRLNFLPTLDDVRAIAPGIGVTVLAASFCPTDGHADPVATVNAYLAAAERAGATITSGEAVTGLSHTAGRITEALTSRRRIPVGAVLLASGIKVNALLGGLGARIPLTIPIVTVVRTAPLPPLLGPVLGVANADLAARQEASGALRFTSGMEIFSGTLDEGGPRPVARPSTRQVMATIAKVARVLPAVNDTRFDTAWGGLLDLTPDALPVIDHVPGFANAVVAAGFSGHGFGIGPVTGPLAADLVLRRPPSLSLEAFRFERFGDNPTAAASLTLHG